MPAPPVNTCLADARKRRMAVVTAIGVAAWALPAALAIVFRSPDYLWLYLACIIGWAKAGQTSR